jgi:3-deoxy-7-phosphoheptulonate synthase
MEDTRVIKYIDLGAPDKIKKHYPLNEDIKKFVDEKRLEIKKIIDGDDTRFLVVVGPCSIHDTELALDYAKKLKILIEKYNDSLLIVMKVYFENSDGKIDWDGMINDPDMDRSYNINKGLLKARKLMIELNELGVPVGYELLDNVIPQYLSDLISWGLVDTRAVNLASGASFPVGFNNNVLCDINIAFDAVISSKLPNIFLGVADTGVPAVVSTRGNDNCHVILSGSRNYPNYTDSNKYDVRLMIDCSRGNSNKDFRKQKVIVKYIGDEIIRQSKSNKRSNIFGLILESNIYEGCQTFSNNLKYGISITDGCISFEETETLLLYLSKIHLVSNMNK